MQNGGGSRQNFLSPHHGSTAGLFARLVNTPAPSLAVIDGTLCQLARDGTRRAGHTPLATAIVEFQRGPMCYFVREHPHGLLPGIPNLYCLDGDFRLQWLAEWPATDDPCASIVGLDNDTLVVTTTRGTVVRIDAASGRLIAVEPTLAAVG